MKDIVKYAQNAHSGNKKAYSGGKSSKRHFQSPVFKTLAFKTLVFKTLAFRAPVVNHQSENKVKNKNNISDCVLRIKNRHTGSESSLVSRRVRVTLPAHASVMAESAFPASSSRTAKTSVTESAKSTESTIAFNAERIFCILP